jgi:hypothetical protein
LGQEKKGGLLRSPWGSAPALQKLCDATSGFLAGTMAQKLDYEAVSIILNHDPLLRKHALGGFTIQRRDNALFSDNKYFSTAPIPTDMHIKLLEEFEADIFRLGK